MQDDPYAAAPMTPGLEKALVRLVQMGFPRPRPPLWLRLWRGVFHHFIHRLGEWLGTAFLLQFGWLLYFPPPVFSPTNGFAVLAQWGSEERWGLACLGVGTAHLLALAVNGTFRRFRWSPHIRAACSLVAFFLWGQIVLGIWLSGTAPTGVGTYRIICCLEILNFLLAMRDVGVTEGRRATNG